jgi:hypothetical protein
MEDIFKPHSLTIGTLLGNADALYQIPRYQRPYSWGVDQLNKLWDDLREAQESEPNYFLGSIITSKPEDASKYLDIVDGQQRLTTLIILLCVCRDLYPGINDDIQDDPFVIDHTVVKSSIRLNDKFERLRLRTHSNHESDFQELIIRDGKAIQNKRPKKKELQLEQEPRFKFQNTAFFFTEKLSELGKSEAGVFVNYLFNKVKIIRIDCQSVNFAIKLFQVLNDRGLDLSSADLIKSYLIGKIHKKYENEPELKRQSENQFIDDWKSCEGLAVDTEENLNNYFVMFEYFNLARNPDRSLFDELKVLFENRDSNQVIKEFRDFIGSYRDRVYLSTDPTIYCLYYLPWTMYWRTLVTTAVYVNYPWYNELLSTLKRYFYVNWIAGNTLSKIKQTSFNLIGHIKVHRDLEFIRAELTKQLTMDVERRAIDELNSDIYFEPWCKPLLYMIEYNQIDKPQFLEMDGKHIQVEHILPRAFKKEEGWKFASEIDDIESWINSGANLTLLSGVKNLNARNYKFSEKIKSYDGTGFEDSKDQKITSFKITQKIVNDFHSGKYNKEWNIDALNDRWSWFCVQVRSVLNLEINRIVSRDLGS